MGDNNVQLQWEGRARYYTERVPPVVLKPVSSKCCEPNANENMIIEGNNLGVMAALLAGAFKLRKQVDILLWDPPYNTGSKDFRYCDDYGLSRKEVQTLKTAVDKIAGPAEGWVSLTDPSRHTKWLNFMAIRLWYGKKLLKKDGIIAVTIGDEEVFRLGMLMDEIFLPENRLACAPWLAEPSGGKEKTGIRNGHAYVLIYHNGDPSNVSQEQRSTGKLDLKDKWGKYRKGRELRKWGGISLRSDRPGQWFSLNAPDGTKVWPIRNDGKEGHWRWGQNHKMTEIIKDPENAHWEVRPFDEGVTYRNQRERLVPYEKIRDEKRAVGWTSWLDAHGTNAEGTQIIKQIFGSKVFDTPKPVSLYEWIIRLHDNDNAVVLDAFAGSGTAAHAVLKTNAEDETNRRFILIESGQGDDKFCDQLTAERVRRVISGKWATGKIEGLPGGFTYYKAGIKVTKAAIMAAKREEMADIILQSLEESSAGVDCRVEDPSLEFMIGRTRQGKGVALVWGHHGDILTADILEKIKQEAERSKLKRPIYIYATSNEGPNGSPSYIFQLIPDSILASLGLTDALEGD
jgi:adenine-specific DNA-methyltransferase